MLGAIAFNIALGYVVRQVLNWPLWLDSVGTILVGALLGPLAGAAIGALTSVTWGFAHVRQIGLYDIVQKVDQDDRFTTVLARHRYISTQPLTLLKVFHFDVYASDEAKSCRVREIFHGQDAMRLLGTHPNLLRTGDMFAWNDDSFVEPVEHLERGQFLETLLDGGVHLALRRARRLAGPA